METSKNVVAELQLFENLRSILLEWQFLNSFVKIQSKELEEVTKVGTTSLCRPIDNIGSLLFKRLTSLIESCRFEISWIRTSNLRCKSTLITVLASLKTS